MTERNATIPLSQPVSMTEVAKRMSKPGKPIKPREARTALRKLEWAKGIKILLKGGPKGSKARWYTTEALIRLHLPELHDRPQRVLSEVRGYQARVRELIAESDQAAQTRESELAYRIADLERRLERLEQK